MLFCCRKAARLPRGLLSYYDRIQYAGKGAKGSGQKEIHPFPHYTDFDVENGEPQSHSP